MTLYSKFPWPQPISIYDSDGPRNRTVEFSVGDVQLRIERTNVLAPDTLRDRFKCICVTCDEVLHEATTGSSIRFRDHLKTAHGMKDD